MSIARQCLTLTLSLTLCPTLTLTLNYCNVGLLTVELLIRRNLGQSEYSNVGRLIGGLLPRRTVGASDYRIAHAWSLFLCLGSLQFWSLLALGIYHPVNHTELGYLRTISYWRKNTFNPPHQAKPVKLHVYHTEYRNEIVGLWFLFRRHRGDFDTLEIRYVRVELLPLPTNRWSPICVGNFRRGGHGGMTDEYSRLPTAFVARTKNAWCFGHLVWKLIGHVTTGTSLQSDEWPGRF